MCKILSLANLNAIKSIKIAKKDKKKSLFLCMCAEILPFCSTVRLYVVILGLASEAP